MKNLYQLIAILTVSLITFSCNPEETPEQGFLEGKWELVEIRSSWTLDVFTGEEMYKRETYTFNQNGTFTKTRLGAEFDLHGSGTYTTTEIPDAGEGMKT